MNFSSSVIKVSKTKDNLFSRLTWFMIDLSIENVIFSQFSKITYRLSIAHIRFHASIGDDRKPWRESTDADTLKSLTIYLLVTFSSADQFCKQFGPRSGPTKRRAWSGSKLFDTVGIPVLKTT